MNSTFETSILEDKAAGGRLVLERAHAALQKSEHQMRLITEHIPAKIAYFDAKLKCRFANSDYCAFYQLDPQGILGMPLREISGEDSWRAIRPLIERVKRGEHVVAREERTTADGVRHVEVHRLPDMAPGHGFRGCFAMLLDITEQVRAEVALRATEARLRAIFDHEPECVTVIESDGMLAEINHTGLRMLEAESIQQVRERGLLNFATPDCRAALAECIRRCLDGETVDLEYQITGLKGTPRWVATRASPLSVPGDSVVRLFAITRDITEQKLSAQQVEYLSNHDLLTRLPNRALFHDRLERAVAHARRRGETVSVMLLNVDRFSRINESLGNAGGDELLREFGARLTTTLRDVDTIARLGGNDFAVLAEGIATNGNITAIADKLMQLMVAPFTAGGQEIIVSASIGIAFYPGNIGDPSDLLNRAEAAMRQAKREGGSAYALYEEQQTPRSSPRLELERGLRRALENGELSVHFQPKVNLANGNINGVEALLRWVSPDLGAVDPAQFIPIAEETGLIIPIGAWVLRTACAQVAAWRRDGYAIGIAVNLSPRQFRHKNLLQDVTEALAATGLAAPHLELEITEGTAMSHAEYTIQAMAGLKQLGVKLAVDDFGTGYSSLAYLRNFPLDCLKIDRSFVQGIQSDASSEKIVHAMLALAHSLQLKVVAEGVETEGQRNFLAAAGCDEGQGYLFGRALPASDFRELLRKTP